MKTTIHLDQSEIVSILMQKMLSRNFIPQRCNIGTESTYGAEDIYITIYADIDVETRLGKDMGHKAFRRWQQREYASLAWYTKNGKIYFPLQSDIECIALEILGDHGGIYIRPIPFGPTQLVFNTEEHAWTFEKRADVEA